jgi:hypothetical protein
VAPQLPDIDPYRVANVEDTRRFLRAALDQVGDRYEFGAEADRYDADPTSFDSSELVEWAARQAGVTDLPDGSWNQYRWLHDRRATVPVDEALRTPGALVFGFSSDPTLTEGRPARAYVGISLGNGKVIDVSERAGEVREMDPGGFYEYGAVIPDLHGVDDAAPYDDPFGDPLGLPGGAGTMPEPGAVTPAPAPPADPVTPVAPVDPVTGRRKLHEQFPGDEQYPDGMPPEPEAPVCTPDEPLPEEQVCYPDDDGTDYSTDTYGDL